MTDKKEDQEEEEKTFISVDLANPNHFFIGCTTTTASQIITHALTENTDTDLDTWSFRQEYINRLVREATLGAKSPADIKYPHKCFKCKKPIFWTELLRSNVGQNREHLIKLWQSKYVQFLCCGCYQFKDFL